MFCQTGLGLTTYERVCREGSLELRAVYSHVPKGEWGMHMSYSLNSSYPIESPIYPPLRSLDYSSYRGWFNGS